MVFLVYYRKVADMITDFIIGLINAGDTLFSSSSVLSDLITRLTTFITTLNTGLSNIQNAFAWLYFFIPKIYFDPLIKIFLLIMFLKCITALVNLVYP